MSKWRPSDECLYVIPDIHGASHLLEKILKRILPLRTTGGVKDKLIFLGDYVDRHSDSHKVLDILIGLKEKYPEQVICLMGNHELMMLEALGKRASIYQPERSFHFWLINGGAATVNGYINKAELDVECHQLTLDRVRDLVPQEHFDFLKGLDHYHEHENYVFVHGGYDPTKKPSDFPIDVLAWDRSLVKLVELLILNEQGQPWEPVVITGHTTRKQPIITEKFMMLDIGSPRQLLCVELNSMEAYLSRPEKRLAKYTLKESIKNT